MAIGAEDRHKPLVAAVASEETTALRETRRALRAAAALREDAEAHPGRCYPGGVPVPSSMKGGADEQQDLIYGLLGCPAEHELDA